MSDNNKGLIDLRLVVEVLRQHGRFDDEEGEVTNNLQDLIDSLSTPPAVMPAGKYVLSKTLEVASNESVADAVHRGLADGSVMPAAPSDAAEARYRFLLGFLIERGVLTNDRYSDGTWCLRGIYGVDDSGLRGAGRTAEEAIDNAIVAANLDPATARMFWQTTHAALSQTMQPQAGVMAPVPYDKHEAEILAVIDERDRYHDMADQLAAQIAAITETDLGEHSSDNDPWRNAMLAADEWIARDLRAMFAGESEPRSRRAQAEPAAGEQAARNWIHGEAIDYLEVPDVQDESGINAHYSRDLVLQCIDAAIEAGKEQAGAVAQTPMFFASAEQANALQDRPDDDEGGVYLPLRKTAAGKFTMPLYAAPGAAIAAREQAKPGERRERLTDADLDAYGDWLSKNAERRALFPVEQSELMNTAMLCIREVKATRSASREEAPATPQEAVTDEQIMRAWLTNRTGGYIKFARDVLALALTQPTTVQQADALGLLRRSEYFVSAYADRNPKWDWDGTMQDPSSVHALLAEIRAALKGMQPGERKEGV